MALVQQLDEQVWDIQDRLDAGTGADPDYLPAFGLARAASAIWYALDNKVFEGLTDGLDGYATIYPLIPRSVPSCRPIGIGVSARRAFGRFPEPASYRAAGAFGLPVVEGSPGRSSRPAAKGSTRAASAPIRAKPSHGRPAENPSAVTNSGARTSEMPKVYCRVAR
jgi:hypothetical protein